MQATAESDDEGLYVSPSLIPGSYQLSAVRAGFRTEVFGPVLLEVNQTVRIDFALEVGDIADSIQVNAAPEQSLSPKVRKSRRLSAANRLPRFP